MAQLTGHFFDQPALRLKLRAGGSKTYCHLFYQLRSDGKRARAMMPRTAACEHGGTFAIA